MVEQSNAPLDAVFHALSDPTRRAMLHRLARSELAVSELAEPYAMSLAGASKHIRVLERAGLVQRTVRGRKHVCRLEAGRLAEAHRWIARYEGFWNGRLDTLEVLLRAGDSAGATVKGRSDDTQ